jgi:outer membrane lipoprotein-sorting protein
MSKRKSSLRLLLIVLVSLLFTATMATSQTGSGTNSNADLEKVLSRMDTTAAQFRSAEANLSWEQYQKVINDSDVEEGKIYFRRNGKDIQMMADISKPAPRQILYSNGKIQLFEPKVNRVTPYSAGKNRADVESFVVLGFGGGGHELLKTFDVKYAGTEDLNGVQTDKLELTPKSARLRGMFEKLVMWIDPKLGIAVQQKFFQPEGDYRLTKYSDIRLNQKIPDNTFKLKTDSKTTTVSPQG